MCSHEAIYILTSSYVYIPSIIFSICTPFANIVFTFALADVGIGRCLHSLMVCMCYCIVDSNFLIFQIIHIFQTKQIYSKFMNLPRFPFLGRYIAS